VVQRGYDQVSIGITAVIIFILKENHVWQYRHSIFKVPNFSRWTVVVTGSKFIDELRKAPEDVLSFSEATDEVMTQASWETGYFNL
jgi:hypothetical protein